MQIFPQARPSAMRLSLAKPTQQSACVGDLFAVVAFQFVAANPVDDVHAEMVRARLSPTFRLVIAASSTRNQFLDVLRNRFGPRVVIGLELARVGREQLDDRAERTLPAKAPRADLFSTCPENGPNMTSDGSIPRRCIKILFHVRDENRPGQNRVRDRF